MTGGSTTASRQRSQHSRPVQRRATASHGRGRARTRQRPPAGRWRRRLAILVFVGVFAVICIRLASPLVQKAIRNLTLPLHDSAIIVTQAHAKGLDPALVAAVINAETGFDARTSPTGALGLMQVEPRTAEILARQSGATTFEVGDLGTPAVNIAYGSYYLKQLLKSFGGDEVAALAAYNGGETNVDRWIAAAHQAGHDFGIADIPFPATRAYVEKVLADQAAYRADYPRQLGLS